MRVCVHAHQGSGSTQLIVISRLYFGKECTHTSAAMKRRHSHPPVRRSSPRAVRPDDAYHEQHVNTSHTKSNAHVTNIFGVRQPKQVDQHPFQQEIKKNQKRAVGHSLVSLRNSFTGPIPPIYKYLQTPHKKTNEKKLLQRISHDTKCVFNLDEASQTGPPTAPPPLQEFTIGQKKCVAL